MNEIYKYSGFCFALLLAIFNISGVLAKEKPLFLSSEEGISSNEILQTPGLNSFWAEEVVAQISLPEYSEEQFSKTNLLFTKKTSISEVIDQPENSSYTSKRDLRAFIRNQLFPFHFFL